ncbi:YncE family protein [candidate division KSB1 bacterium]|nr:YncE family protein [candidate division KSB1 bacterium]
MKAMKKIIPAILFLTIFAGQAFAQWNISIDGTLAVLNKSDNTVTFFSLKTGEAVVTLPTGNGPHEGIISPDGKTLVVSDYESRNPSTLTVIDVENKKVTKKIELGSNRAPHGIMFLMDGERIIASTENTQTFSIVNIKTGRVETSINGRLSAHMVVITPDGGMAFGSSIREGAVNVVDMKKGEYVKTIQTGAGAEGIDISPDGKEVWVGNRAANTISVIDVATLEVTATMVSKEFPIRVKFTADGKYLLASNMNSNEVGVFDVKTRKEIQRIPMLGSEIDKETGISLPASANPAPIGILVHPNNKFAFIANSGANVVSVIDLIRWKVVARIKTGNTPDGMAFSKLNIK